MAGNDSLTRQEYLPKLESFCKALDGMFARAGVRAETSQEVWRLGVAAECVRCGIRVYGDELYALSQPPSEKFATLKLGRLRRGDCAREGCNSYYYRLTFYPYDNLDWPALLAGLEDNKTQGGEEAAGPGMALHAWRLLVRSPATQRVAIGMVVVALLLAVRQWRIGGRIPLLREPRQFQAAPECITPRQQ